MNKLLVWVLPVAFVLVGVAGCCKDCKTQAPLNNAAMNQSTFLNSQNR